MISVDASRPSFEYLILLISCPRWIGEPSQITASLPEILRRIGVWPRGVQVRTTIGKR